MRIMIIGLGVSLVLRTVRGVCGFMRSHCSLVPDDVAVHFGRQDKRQSRIPCGAAGK